MYQTAQLIRLTLHGRARFTNLAYQALFVDRPRPRCRPPCKAFRMQDWNLPFTIIVLDAHGRALNIRVLWFFFENKSGICHFR